MILAAYIVVGFVVAGVYATGMLKGRRDRLHRLGLLIPLTIGLIAAPLQFLVGDTAAREVADNQPAKFAGMECIQKTGGHQTEYLGGVCTSSGVKAAIPIPDLDSFLVGFSANTKVTGLNSIPPENRPPANTLLHLSFDTMVGICTLFIALGIWLPTSGGGAATSPRRSGSCAPWRSPARRRCSRCGAGGSSPRSAASPGSSRATCGPRKR